MEGRGLSGRTNCLKDPHTLPSGLNKEGEPYLAIRGLRTLQASCHLKNRTVRIFVIYSWINRIINNDSWEIWIYWWSQQKTSVFRLCFGKLTRHFITLKSGATIVMILIKDMGIKGWEQKKTVTLSWLLSLLPCL